MQRFIVYALLLVLAIYAAVTLFETSKTVTLLPYSQFLKKKEKGEVKKVIIREQDLEATLKNGKHVKTYYPNDPDLIKLLKEKKVLIEVKPSTENSWLYVLLNIIPYVLIIAFFILLIRHAQASNSQAFNFTKSKAKFFTSEMPKVTFKDVAGLDEAVEELKEVVDFLKNPEKYSELGARIPKGVLLIGPPGTGKTLLGRAVAGEAGVAFLYVSGSEFVEMFVGVGAARVRDLFDQAKKSAPCIVFIDEIDAVGRHRGAGLGGGHDEREQTLNQLLVEMDGFEVNSGIILLAATNRPDILDPALLRPGRFDRKIYVDKPDFKGRLEILKIHARNKKLGKDVDLEIIAKQTTGFTGADLENLLNEAALIAARKNKSEINMEDCEEAMEKIVMGPAKKNRIIPPEEKKIIAYHESGHTLVAKLLPHADRVRKVTIIPRGMALGATWQAPDEDKHNLSKEELMDEISVLLAGRAAEEIAIGSITTGAENDLQRATEIARRMVTQYGMSEKVGLVAFEKSREIFLGKELVQEKRYSEATASLIDQEVSRIVMECYERAKKLIKDNMDKLHELANRLLEKETLFEDEINEIIFGKNAGDETGKALPQGGEGSGGKGDDDNPQGPKVEEAY